MGPNPPCVCKAIPQGSANSTGWCALIGWRACNSLPVVIFSADSVPLSASTVQFSSGQVSVFDQRLYNYRSAMECPTGYIQVPNDRLPTSRQPQHTSVVYPNVSWRVYNCRPVLTFSTGRSTLDRQCNSLPAEHIPIVRLSHPESMRFSTGCASLGMASTSISRFQNLMISRFQEFEISCFNI